MKIAVYGAGTWGTVIAHMLCKNGHEVSLWHYKKEFCDYLKENRLHPNLPGLSISSEITIQSDIDSIDSRQIHIIATPTHSIRSLIKNIKLEESSILVSLSKGIEFETGFRISEIILSEISIHRDQIVVLSGPSHAENVCNNKPTSVVSASTNFENAKLIQEVFSNDFFRVYTSNDIVGVELGGSIKNIIAVSAGICYGLELGDNSIAALISRGLEEIVRLGISMGAERKTLTGLSGLGDLVATSFSMHSRNRLLGEKIAKSTSSVDAIIKSINMVSEGYYTAKSVYKLSQDKSIEMPICNEVYKILYDNKSPKLAIQDLMSRNLKVEN